MPTLTEIERRADAAHRAELLDTMIAALDDAVHAMDEARWAGVDTDDDLAHRMERCVDRLRERRALEVA